MARRTRGPSVVAILCFIAVGLASSNAVAVARHDRVSVKEIKKGGEVVGLKINLVVHPEGYNSVRVSLGPAGKMPPGNNYMPAASKPGQAFHFFKDVKLEPRKPKPLEFKLLYKDHPNLKPGTAFEIVSAYPKGGSSWHVYGMTRRAQPAKSYTFPGKAEKTAKRLGSVARLRRGNVAQQRRERARRGSTHKNKKPTPKTNKRIRAKR